MDKAGQRRPWQSGERPLTICSLVLTGTHKRGSWGLTTKRAVTARKHRHVSFPCSNLCTVSLPASSSAQLWSQFQLSSALYVPSRRSGIGLFQTTTALEQACILACMWIQTDGIFTDGRPAAVHSVGEAAVRSTRTL